MAAAYAAVGQAGATGYIAAMGLAGYTPDVIRPAALWRPQRRLGNRPHLLRSSR